MENCDICKKPKKPKDTTRKSSKSAMKKKRGGKSKNNIKPQKGRG